jgi:hypothetical protein
MKDLFFLPLKITCQTVTHIKLQSCIAYLVVKEYLVFHVESIILQEATR